MLLVCARKHVVTFVNVCVCVCTSGPDAKGGDFDEDMYRKLEEKLDAEMRSESFKAKVTTPPFALSQALCAGVHFAIHCFNATHLTLCCLFCSM